MPENGSKKNILIFTGGGVKIAGTAIGVLKALREYFISNDITIDRVVGISGGAIVGGMHALGYQTQTIAEIFESLWQPYLFKDFNRNPTKGILKGALVETALARAFQNKTFAETKIPFSAVASIFKQRSPTPILLESGFLHEAVRASLSIPFLFEPKIMGGVRFYDGEMGVRDVFDILELISEAHPATLETIYFVELDEQHSLSKNFSFANIILKILKRRRVLGAQSNKKPFEKTDIIKISIPILDRVPLWNMRDLPRFIMQGETVARFALSKHYRSLNTEKAGPA
ncbi:MAG TPA: patatin-like phospholipase family protein [Candidatus Paceibacterota bacterium]